MVWVVLKLIDPERCRRSEHRPQIRASAPLPQPPAASVQASQTPNPAHQVCVRMLGDRVSADPRRVVARMAEVVAAVC